MNREERRAIAEAEEFCSVYLRAKQDIVNCAMIRSDDRCLLEYITSLYNTLGLAKQGLEKSLEAQTYES